MAGIPETRRTSVVDKMASEVVEAGANLEEEAITQTEMGEEPTQESPMQNCSTIRSC